jgi:hypothetical protein
MPTPRNLAGAPSGVNIFGDSEYPNAASGVPQRAYPEVTSIGLHTATNGATGGGGTGGRFDCGLSNRSAPICARSRATSQPTRMPLVWKGQGECIACSRELKAGRRSEAGKARFSTCASPSPC